MQAETGGDGRCGVGARLRAGRERLGLTVLQAAEKLHVDARVLEILESENFEALGASVYVRGHIRRYAELVGEPAAELQGLYSARGHTELPDLTRIPHAQRKADPGRLVVPALVVIIGFTIAGAVWWVLTSTDGTVDQHLVGTPSLPAATTPSPEPASLQPAAPAMEPAGGASVREGAQQTPEPATTRGPAEPAAAPVLRQFRSPSADDPDARSLTLRFSGESWVEVYDAAGERLLFGTGSPEVVRTLRGAAPLRVLLGNAPAVAVEVDGDAADLSAVTRRNNTAEFIVNSAGRLARAPRLAEEGG